MLRTPISHVACIWKVATETLATHTGAHTDVDLTSVAMSCEHNSMKLQQTAIGSTYTALSISSNITIQPYSPLDRCWDCIPPLDRCCDCTPPLDRCCDCTPPLDMCCDCTPPLDRCWDCTPPLDRCWDCTPPLDRCWDCTPPLDRCWDCTPPLDRCWDYTKWLRFVVLCCGEIPSSVTAPALGQSYDYLVTHIWAAVSYTQEAYNKLHICRQPLIPMTHLSTTCWPIYHKIY